MHKMMSRSKMSWHHHAPRRSVVTAHGQRASEDPQFPSRRHQPCSVYLLVHEFEPRFKIGLSQDPLKRAMILPDSPHLQWDACVKATLPTRDRAYQVERAMHKALAVFRIHVRGDDGQVWDGGSEWFDLKGLSHAINLLSMMPEGEDSEKLIEVTTITDESYLGLNQRLNFHHSREMRHFEAAHGNVRHMTEVVSLLRRINDDLTVVRGQPQAQTLSAMAARRSAVHDHYYGCEGQEAEEQAEEASMEAGKEGEDPQAKDAHRSRIPDTGHEVIYIYGLGNHWESNLLTDRFRLSNSQFWMFNTGMKRGFNRQVTWMTRIEFDTEQKSTLVLTMQERGRLKTLPGGPRMLQMWDELWAD